MTITLTQQDYWDLFKASQPSENTGSQNTFETVIPFPEQLGQGSYRFIQLREGVGLRISHFQLHTEDVEIVSPERSHPLEYGLYLSGKIREQEVITAGQYFLYGSGMAPAVVGRDSADEPILGVEVHIEPSVLKTFLGETFDFTRGGLANLIRPNDQLYYQRYGTTTVAMQTALHQILNCPFDGVTKKVYLESKVWELMALLIDQERRQQDKSSESNSLKSDDIERIHHAREILAQQLDHPPSLLDLARQVGLNDCTLKRGFRQVFGETAFGYLHNQRMETARQLLLEGEVNVSEAARQVGFVNRSYFATAFRKKYGVSPSEHLRQTKNSG
ncbi:MAG: helix-turn-helix transcriptional regulator [Leptolyngbya sp. SIO1E4]|nr:helix-turn-helix transcriptional regulator [Leptolyngbya sp. SIO1E4]